MRVIFITFALLLFLMQVSSNTVYAQERSADEIARELSNPATPLWSISNNFEYRSFKGDLPHADGQDSWTYIFQPSLPFSLGDGQIFAVRPAIPVFIDQPVFNATPQGDFDGKAGLGDISFDIVYGKTFKSGLILLGGLFGVLPTASDSAFAGKQLRLGPEALVAVAKPWGVVGALVFHQSDVAGWADHHASITSLQYLYAFGLGKGWQIAAGPTITYDWQADSKNAWSVPVGIGVAKTTKMVGLPWKLQLQVHYYVERPETFGPEWLVKFTVTPVIKNPFVK